MVKYDNTYALKAGQGSSQVAQKRYIIIHSTANPNATGKNEASYMSRNFGNAYTHAIADVDVVFKIGEDGYVAWGAGANANGLSPYQIELAEYTDKTKARKAYNNWISAIREYAKKYGIPLELDGVGNGIKSHAWISNNLGGTDHQDPYAYLKSIGISKAQLSADLKNGIGSTSTTTQSAKPATKAKGIVRVDYGGKGKVRLINFKGEYLDSYVAPETPWKVFGFSDKGILIGNDEYLPYRFAKVRINYIPKYGVNAFDKNTKTLAGTNIKFKHGSEWAVSKGSYDKNGILFFRVSTSEFISGKYTG